MRGLTRSLTTFASLALIYLMPPAAVTLGHWIITGNARPFPNQILYVLFGVFFMHSLVRRRLDRPEDFPL
ncbi:MAG: hypothetical protein WBW04_01365 [Nitrolancea sp.]